MATDLTGGLGDEREYVFATQPADPEMRESVNVWLWDRDDRVGIPRIGVEAVAARWDAHDVQVNIASGDGRVFTRFGVGDAHDPMNAEGQATTLGAGPLSFELVEPFPHWRLRFDGIVHDWTCDEQIAGGSPQGEPLRTHFVGVNDHKFGRSSSAGNPYSGCPTTNPASETRRPSRVMYTSCIVGPPHRYPVRVTDRSAWEGLLSQRRFTAQKAGPVIAVPIQQSAQGGSGTFLAGDAEGRQWWVKPLNNTQGKRVTVTEAIIGAAGQLIGAPVCETAIVQIPAELEGWEFRHGHDLQAGFAHASSAVEAAIEGRELQHRDEDDNHVHHVGVFALYDWCWGGDPQWLYASSQDHRLFSHDHGWYLPEEGAWWDQTALSRRVDEPHMPPWTRLGLDNDEIDRVATCLRGLTRTELRDMLCDIPNEWPVRDNELECVGWFLERRSRPVADRVEALAKG